MPVVRISDELFREVQKYAEPLVDNFESALWKALQRGGSSSRQVIEKSINSRKSDITPQKRFRKPILEVLIELGGKGEAKKIVDTVGKRMLKDMKLGDYSENCDGSKKWEKAVNFQRLNMVHEGLIRKGSPRGIWEITDEGRKVFASLNR